MYRRQKSATWRDNAIAAMFLATFVLLPFAAWSQHLYSCGADDRWAFATVGAIVFPIGVVHGTGVWFGFWG